MKSFSSIDRSRYYILEQISRKYYYENKNNNETAHSRIELKDLDYTEQLEKSLRLSQKSLGMDNSIRNSTSKTGNSRFQYHSQCVSKSIDDVDKNYRMDLAHSSFNQSDYQYKMNMQNNSNNPTIFHGLEQDEKSIHLADNLQLQGELYSKKNDFTSSSSSSKQNRLGMKLISTQNIVMNDKTSSTTSEKSSFQSITPVDQQFEEQNNFNSNNAQQVRKSVRFNDGVSGVTKDQRNTYFSDSTKYQTLGIANTESDQMHQNNINAVSNGQQQTYAVNRLSEVIGFQKISDQEPEKADIGIQTDELQSTNSTPSMNSKQRYEELLEQLHKYNQLLDSMYGWQMFSDDQVFKLQETMDGIKQEIQQIQPTEDDFDEKIMKMGLNLKEFFGSVRKTQEQMVLDKKQMIEEKNNLQQIIDGLKMQISELSLLDNDVHVQQNNIKELNQQISIEKQNYQRVVIENNELKNQIVSLQNQLKLQEQHHFQCQEKSINATIDLIDQGINTSFGQNDEAYMNQIQQQNMEFQQLQQNQNIIIQQFQRQVHDLKKNLIEQLKIQHEAAKINAECANIYNATLL